MIKCNNVLAQIEIIDDAPIKKVLNSLGGWPVITPDWDEKSSSVPKLETLVATLKRKFTLGVLLEEWIGPDDKHSGANVIQVCNIFCAKIKNASRTIIETSERDC